MSKLVFQFRENKYKKPYNILKNGFKKFIFKNIKKKSIFLKPKTNAFIVRPNTFARVQLQIFTVMMIVITSSAHYKKLYPSSSHLIYIISCLIGMTNFSHHYLQVPLRSFFLSREKNSIN
jgi:hypothetical protein